VKCFTGIDLGSTTTKAVVLGADGGLLGRGITNSRSNYKIACDVALAEALIHTRFALVEGELRRRGLADDDRAGLLDELSRRFREEQYRSQLHELAARLRRLTAGGAGPGLPILGAAAAPPAGPELARAVERVIAALDAETGQLYAPGTSRRSDFFRDLAGSRYMALAEQAARETGAPFDRLAGLFDKAILEVENLPSAAAAFGTHARTAARTAGSHAADVAAAVDAADRTPLEQLDSVGTGYGRQTLPFPKEQIRSEILCHGLGAHRQYPLTRTVLDIGGQDTKAIQVDERGIVTSFQMNDRCAAGCGRYLGYIADEMNLGVHELGPLASAATRSVRINSTCTVFAGAELRERLSLGERREDILAGLHRSIILRAMSLLARSGGVRDELTFTGGVARNEAAVSALTKLVRQNYGDVRINISPDSIYTGALGAALFARRAAQQREAAPAEGGPAA